MGESLKTEELFSVKGKYVLITGGGRGIGRHITQGFAENGAVCFITSRDGKACAETAREISAATGGSVVALPGCDLASLEGVRSCAASLRSELRQRRGVEALDVLVHNSGVSWGEPLATFSERGWDKVLDTNVKAVFFLTQALESALAEAARHSSHASVINVGSVAGLANQPFPTFSYDTSKAAVHHLGRHLASALGHSRITVNNLAPGLVPSKMSDQLKVYSSEEELVAGIPLGRVGIARDMAGICIYFASKAGSWTSGATVQVDGGQTVGGGGGVVKTKSKL